MTRKLKKPRVPRPQLTRDDIKVGHHYRAKHVQRVGFLKEPNDRTVVWIGINAVQYDGPSVAIGKKLPTVTMDEFIKWASHEVFDGTSQNAV